MGGLRLVAGRPRRPHPRRHRHGCRATRRARALPRGQLTPLLRAELDLARARRAGDTGDPAAEESLGTAVAALRRFASPYHLAHALLDQAEFLAATGQPDRAEDAPAEARALAETLGARPVAARADRIGRSLAPSRPSPRGPSMAATVVAPPSPARPG